MVSLLLRFHKHHFDKFYRYYLCLWSESILWSFRFLENVMNKQKCVKLCFFLSLWHWKIIILQDGLILQAFFSGLKKHTSWLYSEEAAILELLHNFFVPLRELCLTEVEDGSCFTMWFTILCFLLQRWKLQLFRRFDCSGFFFLVCLFYFQSHWVQFRATFNQHSRAK